MEGGVVGGFLCFSEAFVQLLPVYKSSLLEEDIFQPDFSEASLQEEVTACVTDAVVDRWLAIKKKKKKMRNRVW